jgi:Mg-chelatase subunit ChlI
MPNVDTDIEMLSVVTPTKTSVHKTQAVATASSASKAKDDSSLKPATPHKTTKGKETVVSIDNNAKANKTSKEKPEIKANAGRTGAKQHPEQVIGKSPKKSGGRKANDARDSAVSSSDDDNDSSSSSSSSSSSNSSDSSSSSSSSSDSSSSESETQTTPSIKKKPSADPNKVRHNCECQIPSCKLV